MKKILFVLLVLFSTHAHAASQMNRSQAKVVGAIGGAYVGAIVGVLAGVVVGALRGDAQGAAIGGAIGLPVGAGTGALLGSWIAGSGYPDEDEAAKLDFHSRTFASHAYPAARLDFSGKSTAR